MGGWWGFPKPSRDARLRRRCRSRRPRRRARVLGRGAVYVYGRTRPLEAVGPGENRAGAAAGSWGWTSKAREVRGVPGGGSVTRYLPTQIHRRFFIERFGELQGNFCHVVSSEHFKEIQPESAALLDAVRALLVVVHASASPRSG